MIRPTSVLDAQICINNKTNYEYNKCWDKSNSMFAITMATFWNLYIDFYIIHRYRKSMLLSDSIP